MRMSSVLSSFRNSVEVSEGSVCDMYVMCSGEGDAEARQ